MTLKYLLPVVAVLLAAFTVVHVTRNLPPTPPDPAQRPEPPVGAVLVVTGVVEARGGNIAVASPLPERVAEVFVEAGQAVAAGDPLFRLDDRLPRAELAVRQAHLTAAEAKLARLEEPPREGDLAASAARLGQSLAQLRIDESRLENAERLVRLKVFPAEEMEPLRQAVVVAEQQLARARAEDCQLRAGAPEGEREVARAAVAEARAVVAQGQIALDRLTVRAPSAGTVLQVNVRVGESAAGPAPVVIGSTDVLRVRVEIEDHQVPRFRLTAPARATPRGADRPVFPLRPVRVEPFVVLKTALTGASGERTDSRVLPVLYEFDPGSDPVYVGQQMDVVIEATHPEP